MSVRRALTGMPEAEIDDICRDFAEHFEIGMSQGKTEHEIAAELGNPEMVAKTYFDPELITVGHTMDEIVESAGSVDSNIPVASIIPATEGASAENTSGEAATGPISGAPEKDLSGAHLFVVLLNVLVSWWVAISIFSTLFSFIVSAAGIAATGVLVLVFSGFLGSAGMALMILTGIGLIFLGIAFGILDIFLTKWTIRGCECYVRWNKKLWHEGF